MYSGECMQNTAKKKSMYAEEGKWQEHLEKHAPHMLWNYLLTRIGKVCHPMGRSAASPSPWMFPISGGFNICMSLWAKCFDIWTRFKDKMLTPFVTCIKLLLCIHRRNWFCVCVDGVAGNRVAHSHVACHFKMTAIGRQWRFMHAAWQDACDHVSPSTDKYIQCTRYIITSCYGWGMRQDATKTPACTIKMHQQTFGIY
jgi:hypothetical protein